jgi:excisionase family DNA binding protein
MTDTPSDNGSAPTDTLSVTEAAVRLGVSERTVWRRIKAGKLPTTDTPDGVRVRLSVDLVEAAV